MIRYTFLSFQANKSKIYSFSDEIVLLFSISHFIQRVILLPFRTSYLSTFYLEIHPILIDLKILHLSY